VGNELKYVTISGDFINGSVSRLLIVKLAWTGQFTPAVFPPYIEE
jgi:hypothetical protein